MREIKREQIDRSSRATLTVKVACALGNRRARKCLLQSSTTRSFVLLPIAYLLVIEHCNARKNKPTFCDDMYVYESVVPPIVKRSSLICVACENNFYPANRAVYSPRTLFAPLARVYRTRCHT